MTIHDMDICLNISSGPAAGVATKVQRSKTAFFKPHVKRLAKKLKHAQNFNSDKTTESKDLSSSVKNSSTKVNPTNMRVKQKSLGAILANNVARSKTVNFEKNIETNEKRSRSNENIAAPHMKAQDEKFPKPLVSFTKPTKENVVKTIVAKSRNIDETKPKKTLSDIFSKNSSKDHSSSATNSLTKVNPTKTRIKQKSLGAIVAKNVARSKTVSFEKNIETNEKHNRSNENIAAPRMEAQDQKFPNPLVSFTKPTKENVLKTIVAKSRNIDETKPKKSLSDIFSKNSSSKLPETKLLPETPKIDAKDGETAKLDKFPHARNVIMMDSGQSYFKNRDNRRHNKNYNRDDPSKTGENQERQSHTRSTGKISSLFGNNPEVPNIGQRLVKPVNETVFSKSTFVDLGIHPYAISNLEQNMQITKTTTVQQKAIPVILTGRNVLVRSQTGSGKTLSYALPIVEILHAIRPKLMRNSGLKALIIVPTRELALQTYECFLKLVKPFSWIVPGYLVGGEKRKAEKARLRRGCTILVATPGRLLDHIEHTEALKLHDVKYFVLDEADRMLDMGYEKDISGIVEALKKQSGAILEKSSYDPLALIRGNSKMIVDEKNEDDAEKLKNELAENENDEFDDLDDSGETTETSRKTDYHSGTESDSDEQEFPIRMKKKKDRTLKEIVKKIVVEETSLNEEKLKSTSDFGRQTILLSATLTAAVEKLAGLTMTNPVLIDAAQDNLNEVGGHLSEINEDLVVPQGVTQNYIVTPPKLRMVTLSAYIAGKCQVAGQHKILVFMATQDMIDYHADILSTVLGKPSDDDDEDSDPLVDVEFFKLHGSMTQKERTEVFKTFRKARSGVLFCTDVASRGLDLPKVDTVVQYTGPLSARDYVHRIGRTARAGTSGASTIFLTPSEIDFVRMLESRRIRIKQENMNDVLDKLMGPLSKHHTVEATATALQNQFENLVIENKQFHSKACKAYVSWIRFYSSYPRDMREIFNRKDLHLGHYAKSFALRDPPQRIGGIGKTLREKEPSKPQHNNRLSNERPAKHPQKRQNTPGSGQKPGLLKKSRMLNVSEYGDGLESIKKSKKSR